MVQPTLTIVEVLDRSKQGRTEPFICRGDDGEIYYVKGAGAGRRSLICEWVSAKLATAFGLPIAAYTLADVPASLMNFGARRDMRELGSGLVFASQRVHHAQELSATTRDCVPSTTALDVLVFDWWVHNEDRHLTDNGGNPNLLWDAVDSQLAVIDHNLAFDSDFNAQEFLASHVFANQWHRIYANPTVRNDYRRRMSQALTQLPAIRADIPDSWWWVDHGVPANITWDTIATCLMRYSCDNFWDTP